MPLLVGNLRDIEIGIVRLNWQQSQRGGTEFIAVRQSVTCACRARLG